VEEGGKHRGSGMQPGVVMYCTERRTVTGGAGEETGLCVGGVSARRSRKW